MKINAAGLKIIKDEEGLRLNSYLCPAGIPTIGWGHTGPETKLGQAITLHQAEEILKLDLTKFEDGVAKIFAGIQLSENQFSALVSFAFNVGLGPKGLGGSTLAKRIKAGDFVGAANQFPRWNKSGGVVLKGLVRRRAAEKALFES